MHLNLKFNILIIVKSCVVGMISFNYNINLMNVKKIISYLYVFFHAKDGLLKSIILYNLNFSQYKDIKQLLISDRVA